MSRVIWTSVSFEETSCRHPLVYLPFFTERKAFLPILIPAKGTAMLLNEINEVVTVKHYFVAPAIVVAVYGSERYRIYFMYDEGLVTEHGVCVMLGMEYRIKMPFIPSLRELEKTLRTEDEKLFNEAAKIISEHMKVIDISNKRRMAEDIVNILWSKRRRQPEPDDAVVLLATLIKLITRAYVKPGDVVARKHEKTTRGSGTG